MVIPIIIPTPYAGGGGNASREPEATPEQLAELQPGQLYAKIYRSDDSVSRWIVKIYRHPVLRLGDYIALDCTTTKWGARRAARHLMRYHSTTTAPEIIHHHGQDQP